MDESVIGDKKTWLMRVVPDASRDRVAAWEMIEAGRFMPRRIRGSFPGRELG